MIIEDEKSGVQGSDMKMKGCFIVPIIINL